MRIGLPAVALSTALAALVAGAAASKAGGRSVRIEAPRRLEVFVPAGTFRMGIDDDTATSTLNQCQLAYYPPNAQPRYQSSAGAWTDFCTEYSKELSYMKPREVVLDEYAIDRDEVSVTDYRRCVAAGACTLDALVTGDDRYIRGEWPIVNVTWDEAQHYCGWRGARLPTEAEWERAARGDHPAATWPWGELEQPKDFNHGQPRSVAMRELERRQYIAPIRAFGDPDDSDGANLLAPPGSYPWGESPWGTRDQAGNVAEWTADAWFDDDEHLGYQGLTAVNPRRDGSATQPRVVRGGSWRQPTFLARSNLRDPFNKLYDPTQRYSHVGFRCARSMR